MYCCVALYTFFGNLLEVPAGGMNLEPQPAFCGWDPVHQNEHRAVAAFQENALLVRNEFRDFVRSPENTRREVHRPQLEQGL